MSSAGRENGSSVERKRIRAHEEEERPVRV